MNYIRDHNIVQTQINSQFYKIFINLDKNKLQILTKYIEEHNKSERNSYFQKEFESAFTSFLKNIC